eukprot:8766088-Ditylum_brightwellii.AAC.1
MSGAMRDPPHMIFPRAFINETMKGNCLGMTGVPPTIRALLDDSIFFVSMMVWFAVSDDSLYV